MNCNLNCADCLKDLCMRKVPLFASLQYDDLKNMAEHTICCTYEKGERLLNQGDVPQALTVILKGRAKIMTVTADGREKILSILSRDDYFGELYLFGNRQAAYSVEALEQMRTCAFSREHFRQMLIAYPQMSARLVEELGKRVIRLEGILQTASGGRADARIAALLMEFFQKYAADGPEGPEILLPLSREGMANYLGVARETVSRKISRMEKEGIVLSRGNKRLRVLRPDLLAAQAAGDGEE